MVLSYTPLALVLCCRKRLNHSDQFLLALFSSGTAFEKHFGDVLPVAFITKGGTGDSKATAFRICAPSGPVEGQAD
jgi:hypothetical protein